MKAALIAATLLLASAVSPHAAPRDMPDTQIDAWQLAYATPQYRCTTQYPSGKRYCYRVPTVRRPNLTI